MLSWFDAHLDLAYLAELGRDMHAPLHDCRGPLQPAAVTLPALRQGRIHACLGTVFTEAVDSATTDAAPYTYPHDNTNAASIAGLRQIKLYHAWRDAGLINIMPPRGHTQWASTSPTLQLGILMECADPIESPETLVNWYEHGVIAIGLAWWRGSRYAGGNGTPGRGLTPQGRELVARIDQLGIVHDLTHLSQHATDDLLELSPATPIASHSNCRALLEPDNERHLADSTIREVGNRNGMIGINLVRNFIRTGIDRNNPNDRPTIADTIAHVERICEIMGHRRGVGLGSDMDGGITAHDLPAGINRPADLTLLAEELHRRNWSDADIEGFAFSNWARFWSAS
ncbi:MAG: membrane dipeptidase [Phycisphaeraceae bacterium]|nr:membrane dipeptidase [Phycisphaeraceae bacterium]MCW5763982.1 membrane dipeptidase [Phycisphaeraceae bacterium]